MEKRKRGDHRSEQEIKITEALDAGVESHDYACARDLLDGGASISDAYHQRNEKAIGVALTFLLFALYRSLQYLPTETQASLQNEIVVQLLPFVLCLCGGYDIYKYIEAARKMKNPIRHIQVLAENLGIQHVHIPTVIRLAERTYAASRARSNVVHEQRQRQRQNNLVEFDTPAFESETDESLTAAKRLEE